MNAKNETWIRPLRTHGERIRLLCFPYAGGGPHIFQKWAGALPDHVGLYAVHLPGRGARLNHPPIDRMSALVEAVVGELQGLPQDLPLVMFGHSMGALLAFESIRSWCAAGGAAPHLLVASACKPPQWVHEREKLYELPDEAFIQKLKELGGTPSEVLAHRELLEWLMPTLRADFAVMDNYRHEPGLALDCPLTVLSGSEDIRVPGHEMAGWREHTTRSYTHHEISGGHFFIHTAERELVALLLSEIHRFTAVSGLCVGGVA